MRLISLQEFAVFLYSWAHGDRSKPLGQSFIELHGLHDDVELANTPHSRAAVRVILNRYVED